MVQFGMDNTFVTFEDQYWIYGGDLNYWWLRISILCRFSSSPAAYILEKAEDIFYFYDSLFNEIYHDDGIDIKNSILKILTATDRDMLSSQVTHHISRRELVLRTI